MTSDRSNNKHHHSRFNPGNSHLKLKRSHFNPDDSHLKLKRFRFNPGNSRSKLKCSGFMAIASHLNHDNCHSDRRSLKKLTALFVF